MPAKAIKEGVKGGVDGKSGPYPELRVISNLHVLVNQGGL